MDTAMRKLTLFLVLIITLLAFAKPSEKLPLPQKLQNELPWFALDAKDGNSYNGLLNNDKLKEIAKERGVKRIVFSFFATWCAPCKEGFSKMGKKAAELEKNGVLVVLVNIGEKDYEKVGKWVKPYFKEKWLLVFDSFNTIPKDFGLVGQSTEMALPQTLILTPDLKPVMRIGYEGKDFPQVLWNDL
jgi:thiol-disulfide isomerase/thioredoxin